MPPNLKRWLIELAASDDATLIKLAVFGITVSLIATAGIAILIAPNNDYDYDQIAGYREDLANFSGKSMINNTPWVVTHVYTAWQADMPVEDHIDSDGWLFGQEITDYDYLGEAADIKLSPTHKSNTKLSIGDDYSYEYLAGREWWAGTNDWGWTLKGVGDFLGIEGEHYATATGSAYLFSGWRYVFDPTLPFSDGTSSVDGSLSIVWYKLDNGEEGLSGGLQIYNRSTLLASYSSEDIVRLYEGTRGYATTYDFDFEGVLLKLSVRFDQDAIDSGVSLADAFSNGQWSMAISSTSAGNFFDIENSNAFAATTGSMLDTFIGIYTMSLPSVDNPWMDVILWLIVGLPMTLALAIVVMRVMKSVLFFA